MNNHQGHDEIKLLLNTK